MELTYLVRGGDGKEYGPATQEQVAGWIRDGRLTGQQYLKRSDMQDWALASAFIEFQSLFQPPTASVATRSAIPSAVPGSAGASTQINPASVMHMRSGASWFYWMAGLSSVNSI